MKPSHSIWIKVVALSGELESSAFKFRFSSAEKAKDQIENLNLYLDSELIQSLLASLFTYRYHQAGLRMLVLMSYNKPLCDMYRGIMNLCSVLTWFGRAAFLNAGKWKVQMHPSCQILYQKLFETVEISNHKKKVL